MSGLVAVGKQPRRKTTARDNDDRNKTGVFFDLGASCADILLPLFAMPSMGRSALRCQAWAAPLRDISRQHARSLHHFPRNQTTQIPTTKEFCGTGIIFVDFRENRKCRTEQLLEMQDMEMQDMERQGFLLFEQLLEMQDMERQGVNENVFFAQRRDSAPELGKDLVLRIYYRDLNIVV